MQASGHEPAKCPFCGSGYNEFVASEKSDSYY